MKFAPLSFLVLLLTASCASTSANKTLMSTERVRVNADLEVRKDAWKIRNIEALKMGPGPARLTQLSITAFADVNNDGQVQEEERRGNWFVNSSSGSVHLAAGGKLSLSSLEDFDPDVWKLEVLVTYDSDRKDDMDVAVITFAD